MSVDSQAERIISAARREILLAGELDDERDKVALMPLLGGGKFLRGRVLAEVAFIAERTDPRMIASAVAAIELAHTASLVHDDVLDGSGLRRGSPALHTTVGVARAILIGNLLSARSVELSAAAGSAASSQLVTAITHLNRGQLLEDRMASGDEKLCERYMAMKTGSLFQAAAGIGGVIAGLDPWQLELIRSFGASFGLAFQVLDDLADLIGYDTTKPARQDLANGIVTLPVIRQARADANVRRGLVRGDLGDVSERLDVAALIEDTESVIVGYSCRARRDLVRGLPATAKTPWLEWLIDEYVPSELKKMQRGTVQA